VVKGLQHPEDAKLAVRAGCDGIIVSNHGGRQLDGAVGSLDMLPKVVEAVGKDTTVLFDSGTRTGVDILKAFCLGAKGVLIGRPGIYGYAIAGESSLVPYNRVKELTDPVSGKEGAQEVYLGLLADLDRSMSMSGIEDLQGCNKSALVAVENSLRFEMSN
jgi:isopentenyl diphosphate isomerase/L-lactate dehydrogenase-like FMN-dependent dehydrogenase